MDGSAAAIAAIVVPPDTAIICPSFTLRLIASAASCPMRFFTASSTSVSPATMITCFMCKMSQSRRSVSATLGRFRKKRESGVKTLSPRAVNRMPTGATRKMPVRSSTSTWPRTTRSESPVCNAKSRRPIGCPNATCRSTSKRSAAKLRISGTKSDIGVSSSNAITAFLSRGINSVPRETKTNESPSKFTSNFSTIRFQKNSFLFISSISQDTGNGNRKKFVSSFDLQIF